VKGHLERLLPGATVRQIGSFQKNTKIRPIDMSDDLDVDGLVVLGDLRAFAPPGKGLSPRGALDRVARALQGSERYRVMEPETDAPTVVLEYADRFRMELAVGYIDSTGDHPRALGPPCYVVAGHDRWVPADYDYDAEIVSTLNKEPATSRALVPVIKVLKRFVRSAEVPLNSFHLEILSALSLPTATRTWASKGSTWGYDHALAFVLSDAPNHLRGPVALPGSYSPATTSRCTDGDLDWIRAFFKKAGAVAWDICKVQNPNTAIESWRTFFGDPFPPAGSVG
jgi:hypothetical protein